MASTAWSNSGTDQSLTGLTVSIDENGTGGNNDKLTVSGPCGFTLGTVFTNG